MRDFTDRTAFITGAGSGMGLASARRLAAAGAHVVGFTHGAVDAARAAVAADCRSPGQRVRFYSGDVASRAATLAMVGQAVGECGAPDLVIHMAGIGGVAELVDMPYEMFDRMLQVNLYGTRHLVEAVLPHLLNRSDGGRAKLVLAGSMGGFVPVYGYTAYGTSKFAVVGFAKCLRYELKPRGIDVACFCPGEVATPGLQAEREHTHPATVAMKRIGGTIHLDQAIDGLFDGLRRDRFLIVPGLRTRLVHWALRLTPEPLWNVITDAIVGRALRAAAN